MGNALFGMTVTGGIFCIALLCDVLGNANLVKLKL